MANNSENLRKALTKVQELVKATWAKNAPVIADELLNASVSAESNEPHRNITGNMITSPVVGEYSEGALVAAHDYDGKKAVRGMLTKGELFEGISWDGSFVKYKGSVETSGLMAAEENISKLGSLMPRLKYSLVLLRGTPYSNEVYRLLDQQQDVMTDLMVYAKGFIKIEPAR